MLTLFTCPPPLFFPLLLQLIICECLLINRINVFSDALCRALVPLCCFTVFFLYRGGRFLLCPGQSDSGSCITYTLFERGRKKKSLRSINPGEPGAAVSLYFTRPSTPLVKALEAASFRHWARWRVLGGAWLKYIILFQLFFWLKSKVASPADLTVTFAQGPVHKYTSTAIFVLQSKSPHLDLLWRAL